MPGLFRRPPQPTQLARVQSRFASAYKSAIMGTPGLVAYWRLSETSGTSAAAVVGTEGTYKNTPTLGATGLITGDTDTAVQFDDTSFECMNVLAVDLTATDNLSLECWVTPNSLTSAGVPLSVGDTTNGYCIRIGTDLKPRGFTNAGGGLTDAGTAISSSAATHLVLKRASGTWSMWANGVQIDPGTNNTSAPTAPTTRTCIGAIADNNTFWRGTVDEPALYNVALADATILAHYQLGTASAGPQTYNVTASDTVTLSESVARVSTALRTTSDTVTAGNSVARVVSDLRTAADSVGLTDAVARVVTNIRTAADTVTAGNTVARIVSLFRTTSDSVTVSDSVARVISLLRTAADSVSLSDAVAGLKVLPRTVADSITVSNTVARFVGTVRTVSDSVTAGNTVTRVLGLFRRAGSGAFDPDVFDPDVFDTWGDRVILSESVVAIKTGVVVRTLTDALGLSDAVTRTGTFLRTVADSVTAANTVDRLVGLFRTASDSVSLANVVAGIKLIPRTLADSVTASDGLARVVTNLRTAADTVGLSDAVTRAVNRTRTVADSVTLGNTVSAFRLLPRTLADTLNISDAVTRVGAFLRTLADALGITDLVAQVTQNQVERGFCDCSDAAVGGVTTDDALVAGASTSDQLVGSVAGSDS